MRLSRVDGGRKAEDPFEMMACEGEGGGGPFVEGARDGGWSRPQSRLARCSVWWKEAAKLIELKATLKMSLRATETGTCARGAEKPGVETGSGRSREEWS